MKIDLTLIIEAVLALLSAVLTAFVLPMLRRRLSDEQTERLRTWVQVGVAAAEQLFGSKTGQQKKDYVLSLLLSKGLVVDVDEVNAMIESEVHNLIRNTECGIRN